MQEVAPTVTREFPPAAPDAPDTAQTHEPPRLAAVPDDGDRDASTTDAREAKKGQRTDGAGERDGLLDGLARSLRLDVYGPEHMGRRARTELGFASLLLVSLFLFDLGAWTLFFRLMFQPVGAFVAALLPTLVTFVYERQFLTADTSGGAKGWIKIAPAFAIRVGIVIVVSLVTAQPVELLIFKDRIAARVHEESVRAEAVRSQMALAQAQAKHEVTEKIVGEELSTTSQAGRLEKSRKELLEAKKDETVFAEAAAAAKKKVAELKSEVRSLEKRALPKDPVLAQKRRAELSRAKDKLAQATAEAREEEGKRAEAVAKAELAKTERDEAKHDLDDKEKDLEARAAGSAKEGDLTRGRLRDFIAKVASAPAGQVVYEFGRSPRENVAKDGTPGAEFRDADYDFFQRLEVLADLRYGRPPAWPDTTKERRERMAAEYGLADLSTDDPAARARRQQEAADFSWIWRLVFLGAMVIPMLVIAMKFLMPPELRAYFNSEYQAAAGNREAIAFIEATRRARAARRLAGD